MFGCLNCLHRINRVVFIAVKKVFILALAAALGKLQSWNQRIPMQNGNPTTAEMFIVAPLFGGGMAKLFSTHPDINDRIARLREMAGVR